MVQIIQGSGKTIQDDHGKSFYFWYRKANDDRAKMVNDVPPYVASITGSKSKHIVVEEKPT